MSISIVFSEQIWNTPKEYNQYSHSQYTDSQLLIRKINVKQPFSAILDLGCGTGKNIPLFLQRFNPDVLYGSDKSKDMCDEAKRTFFENNKVTIVCQDAQFLNLDKTFDLVISVHLLHWIPKLAIGSVLSHVHKHLSDKGTFAAVYADSKAGLPFQIVLDELKASNAYKEAFHEYRPIQIFHTAPEMEALLNKQKFSIQTLEKNLRSITFTNKDQLKNWIKQWLPEANHLRQKNHSLEQAFMTELVDRYLEKTEQMNYQDNIIWKEYTFMLIATKMENVKPIE